MNKHKTLPIFWAAFSLLLVFNFTPAQAEKKSGDSDTLFNCTWAAATVYPQTILDQATTTVGSTLYSFAGVSTAIIANSYKFDGTTWTPIAPVPVAVEFPAAVNDGTNIYILGGANSAGTPTTTLFKYDPVANSYTTLAPFTTGTWNHCAVYLNGKIYKFAGTGPATNSTNVLEIYDVVSNTWSVGAPYPISSSFVSSWTQGGFVYGAGGITAPGSVVQAKTYRYDPATNMWDDAAIADLPATRWGAATALYTDAVLVGGYVAGAATANISNTAISYDLASNTWQMVPNDLGERARFTGAVLNNSFYVIGGRSVASPAFVGTNTNQQLTCLNTPTNILSSSGSAVVSAGPNGALDPGETVTVSLGVRNIGGPGTVCTTAALTGTLQPTGGVTAPSGPQNYGVLCSGSPGVFRNFTFTVDPALACGASVTASLQMQDGATDYGTRTYTFTTGNIATAFSENFDGVVAPALPAGWTTTFSGLGTAVTTSTIFPDTAPNDIFLSEASNVALSEVASAPISVPAGAGQKLTFRNLYNTEPGFDGLVLEIKIGAGAFQDILAAGGTFASGGYNTTLATGFANPLPGRMAWAGLSGGTAAAPAYITTVVNLPAAAAGQTIQLMWRQGSDNSVIPATNPGSRIDTISITNNVCGGSAPLPSSIVSRKLHPTVGGTPFDITMPLTGPSGVECRRGTGASQNNHQLVVTFGGPVTVGGVSVTSSDGLATASQMTAGNVVTIDIANVADAQVLTVALNNVSDGTNLGNINIPMGILLGDTNGDRVANAGDTIQTRGRAGQLTDATNFRSDVNESGDINAGDTTIVRGRSGNALP